MVRDKFEVSMIFICKNRALFLGKNSLIQKSEKKEPKKKNEYIHSGL